LMGRFFAKNSDRLWTWENFRRSNWLQCRLAKKLCGMSRFYNNLFQRPGKILLKVVIVPYPTTEKGENHHDLTTTCAHRMQRNTV
jgi:hypothetical protein